MKTEVQCAIGAPVLPEYLLQTYLWAYVHPRDHVHLAPEDARHDVR